MASDGLHGFLVGDVSRHGKDGSWGNADLRRMAEKGQTVAEWDEMRRRSLAWLEAFQADVKARLACAAS